jgi:acyl carrier protein
MIQLSDTIQILREVLLLDGRADSFTESTLLLGSLRELDSMAVVSVLTAIEERFGVSVNDDEVSAETFRTVGTLHEMVLAAVGEAA